MANAGEIEFKHAAFRIARSVWDRGNRWHAAVEETWLVRGFRRADASDSATIIAFNALVSLVPTVLLVAAVAGTFLKQEQVLQTATMTTVWALPPSGARDALNGLLQVRRDSTWFGVASVLSFSWIGTTFVGAIAHGMNRTYGVPNRHFVHRRLRGFVVVVIFAGLFATAAIAAAAPTLFVKKGVGVYFRTWLLAEWRGQLASYALALIISLIMFGLMHRLIPSAGQTAGDIWPGTIVGAVLFVVMTQAFPLYLRLAGGGNRYGAVFGLIWLLVTWFYVLAHVLLFSTYVNVTCMRHRVQKRRSPATQLPLSLTSEPTL